MIEVVQNYDSCKYVSQSYYESDTGYGEYACKLTGGECGDVCPLCFKYFVTHNGDEL